MGSGVVTFYYKAPLEKKCKFVEHSCFERSSFLLVFKQEPKTALNSIRALVLNTTDRPVLLNTRAPAVSRSVRNKSPFLFYFLP
jgi:hypothetical protein